ncbi:MAG TPA: YppG family protein [Niallia sp.]|nr:YppG family protein [Niallia sp.]
MYRASFQQHDQLPYMNPHFAYNNVQQPSASLNRQYNLPYMNQQPQWNGMGMNNYPPYAIPSSNQPYPINPINDGHYFHPNNAYKNSSKNIFQNPLHYYDTPEHTNANINNNYMNQSFMNPYPKQSFVPKKQGNMKSIINSFKSQDGSLDFSKMMDTAGMMMNAMNQVTGLVKGVGGIFKV